MEYLLVALRDAHIHFDRRYFACGILDVSGAGPLRQLGLHVCNHSLGVEWQTLIVELKELKILRVSGVVPQ